MNHRSTRRTSTFVSAFARAACCAALLAGAAAAHADDEFPKPGTGVKLVVSNPPGTVPDAIGRALAKGLQDLWGQPVIVENRSGATGMVAASQVARATPDGATLLLAADSAIVVLPYIQDNPGYKPLTDLKPIAPVAITPLVLLVNPALRVTKLSELVALAKARPGALDYGTFGVGSSHHRSMLLLQQSAGISLKHVPYSGSQTPITDLLAGHIPVMWSGISSALPHIQAGKVTALAVSGASRSPGLPDVATVAELGYPGFDIANWFAVFAPAGLADPIAKKIEAAIRSVTATPAFRARLAAEGTETLTGGTDDLVRRIQTDDARNRKLLAAAGLQKD